MKIKYILIPLITIFSIKNSTAQDKTISSEIENTSLNSKFTNYDSLLYIHNKDKLESLKIRDTTNAINAIIKASKIHTTTGNYSKAYDGYWEALIYSNAISDSIHKVTIYRKLGLLYSIFRRSEKAEEYFNLSLKTAKDKSIDSIIKYKALNDTYYIMSSHNREQGNYGLAKKYLDSCRIIYNRISKKEYQFLNAEQGYIYYHEGKYDLAIKLLLPSESYFKTYYPAYLVIYYSFLGDIYLKKEEYHKGEYYYLKSLDFSKRYQSHSNYIPNLYQKLSDLYFKINKKDLAYKNLQLSKNLTEQLFGVRSFSNTDILEIKDAHRIENEKQKKKLEAARLNKLEQQQKILFFRNIALLVSILSLIIISGVIIWYLHKRRKSEKFDYLNKQQLSKEKNEEVLAFKNRELTSSALQLVQKDELILEIKNSLGKLNPSNKREINKILTKIKINKNLDWEEFNARFISVNKVFYRKLTETFPELTQRDHRLCALIKLKFSSKEISNFLGISMESVNTSRYRLRKKMNLKKSVNLSEFIGRL
ncbi:LuxR C-terminal-related transcriptional regulator [uncultured Maribacter sp.]|uniref:tetratricopeptide repeat protein n=1 Tax=uncultured Maribacter sp. TaxID=431308 RepID=UPI00261D4F4E|nr:LuxR C-terminal-related transcriptional regulator [uncultured Maribacter sp.]